METDTLRMSEGTAKIPARARFRFWLQNVWHAMKQMPPKTISGLKPVTNGDKSYVNAQYDVEHGKDGPRLRKRKMEEK